MSVFKVDATCLFYEKCNELHLIVTSILSISFLFLFMVIENLLVSLIVCYNILKNTNIYISYCQKIYVIKFLFICYEISAKKNVRNMISFNEIFSSQICELVSENI